MGAVRDKDRRGVSLGTGGGHQTGAHLNDGTSPWPGHSEGGRQETNPE